MHNFHYVGNKLHCEAVALESLARRYGTPLYVYSQATLTGHFKRLESAMDGLFSALGGKYTTSRDLAEKVTDALLARLGKKAAPCTTAKTALPGGRDRRGGTGRVHRGAAAASLGSA